MYTCHELSEVHRTSYMDTDTSSHIAMHSYMWTIQRPTCMDIHIKTYTHVAMHTYMWLIYRTLEMYTRVHTDTHT